MRVRGAAADVHMVRVVGIGTRVPGKALGSYMAQQDGGAGGSATTSGSPTQRTLKSISVVSAFEYGAFVSGVIYLVYGVIAFILILINAGKEGQLTHFVDGVLYAGATFVGLIIVVLVSTLVGGIAAAIVAFLYNLAARFTGGIRFEME
jgi:hypothetical protein